MREVRNKYLFLWRNFVINIGTMKIRLLIVALGVMCIGSACRNTQPQTILFDGNNLFGWNSVLAASDTPAGMADVFSVSEGNLRVSGEPFGYIYTEEQYENYRLHAEWRWVGEGANSGIFMHIKYPDIVWPEAIECQLCAGKAGDLVMLGGAKIFDMECVGEFPIKQRYGDFERAVGEWNEADIVCDGRQIKIYINGELANECTTLRSRGYIALQSEGGPIEFRNIHLTEL